MSPAAAGEAVLDLAAVRASDAPRVGPKMARLGQLASTGWRVPDGYAITAGALQGWLPPAALAELHRLFSTPAAGSAAAAGPDYGGHQRLIQLSEQARQLIESQPLPSGLADAVAQAHARLESRAGRGTALRVAVRSSAVGEDGRAASFAGQYETYLGVSGADEVLRHIAKCWASGYSAHALDYRRRFGGSSPLRGQDLAVGVLELVDARSAGVAFTLDPVTGDRGRLVVEANWGLGESVVSGQVTPDYWTVERDSGRILERRVGAKLVWSVLAGTEAAGAGGAGASGDGTVLAPLPAELAQAPCLTDDEVRYICRQAAAIEAAEGAPQDVEWAIARDLDVPDSVYFLQHRPETTWAATAAQSAPAPAATPSFDPVQYALRNVFKVPGVTSSPEEPQTGPEWPAASSAGQAARMPDSRPADAELRL
ncbi:MAG TPA: PEP/pyruvate-binding domain-containing protein, partial [Trebonia sp.]|nr:PEP/pyruvate-binding domain-containing protein [Trebonia sp.]